MNTELLKAAFIPEQEWANCYISEDGMIFTPRYDEREEMTQTGEQAYLEYIQETAHPPAAEPTEQEQINALLMRELANLKAQVSAQ